MAELTNAEKAAQAAEAKRRAALSQIDRDEEDRRAAMTQDERDEEDLKQMEADDAEAHQAARRPAASRDRVAITARLLASQKAQREKEATETGVVARGRTVFTEANQVDGHGEGATIKVTPAEKAALTRSGHLKTDDDNVLERTGPSVFSDSALIKGHGVGQGQKPAKS